MIHQPLSGLKVLVVEDEAIVAMLVEDLLGDMGCEVVGPAGGLSQAFAIAEREAFDCASFRLRGRPRSARVTRRCP